MRKGENKGQIWFAYLMGAFFAYLLVYLNPISANQSALSYLWFSSQTYLLPVNVYWNKPDWLINQCIALFLFVFVLKSYFERESHSLPLRRITMFFGTGVFGILLLGFHSQFVIAAFLFLCDGLQFFMRIEKSKNFFSTRRETISILLRALSILLVSLLAAWGNGDVSIASYSTLVTIVSAIILGRVIADFIDLTSLSHSEFQAFSQWLTFLQCLTVLRVIALLPLQSITIESQFVLLIFVCILLFLWGSLCLWYVPHDPNHFFINTFVLCLAFFFALLGLREEILYLALPIFFLALNTLLFNGKKWIKQALLIVEGIFLLGCPFSPFYLLNTTLLGATTNVWFTYTAFILEGIYLTDFFIGQWQKISASDSTEGEQEKQGNVLIGSILLGLALIIVKGLSPIEELSQLSWSAFSPLLFLPLAPLIYPLKRKLRFKESSSVKDVFEQSSHWIENIAYIFIILEDLLREIFEGISTILERESGLVWSLIFIVLLLTLLQGK